jgi:hypothetical protein
MTTLQAAAPEPPTYVQPPAPEISSQEPYQLQYPVEMGLYIAQNDDYPAAPFWEDGWAITEALIVQMRDLAEQQGSEFAVAIIPDRRAVHNEDWEILVAQYPDLLQGTNPGQPTARLSRALSEHNIPTLDLTGSMREWVSDADPTARLYYASDGHYTPNGHTITANTLTDWLLNDLALEFAP